MFMLLTRGCSKCHFDLPSRCVCNSLVCNLLDVGHRSGCSVVKCKTGNPGSQVRLETWVVHPVMTSSATGVFRGSLANFVF